MKFAPRAGVIGAAGKARRRARRAGAVAAAVEVVRISARACLVIAAHVRCMTAATPQREWQVVSHS